MATSASAPQYSAGSAYPSNLQDYYASYQQGYQPAYLQPGYQPPYATQPHAAPAQDSNPPVPGTEQPAADATASTEQQAQYDAANAAYYQQHQEYYQYQQQYYQHYGQYHHYQPMQPSYAQPAYPSQAAAASWAPAAPAQQPVVLPAPVQQAQPAAAPQPFAQAAQPASSSAPAAQRAGYMLMPDGRYKPVAREQEPAKPDFIKFQLPKKSRPVASAAAQPAYTKVAEVKAPAKAPEPVASPKQYPDSLTNWVHRCFQSEEMQKNKDAVQEAIKAIINDAEAKGEKWTRDWDKTPVPCSTSAVPTDAPKAARAANRPNRWDERKPAARASPVARQASPSASLTSRSTRHSYSSASPSRSRSRSRSYTSRSRSRSASSSRSPTSSYASSHRSGRGRKRPQGSLKGSPAGPKGKAKKMRQAGPPESKKQRKRRLAAERQAARQAAASFKKAKKEALLQENDDPTPEELHRRRMRAGRFGSGAVDHSNARPQAPVYAAELSRDRQPDAQDGSEGSWDRHAVQGTCNSLEKKYFRLTGPPDPSAVRPPHVLKAALQRVVRMYRAGQCDMHYAEDQLKAMRQDVTVQHVKGQLPVQIYEAHARACLEHGNGGDFNQCQTVLKVLYEGGSQGCVQEFVAYRVLYQAILRSKESASLLATLEQLSPQDIAHPAVAHALKVRQALVFSQFTAFFQLYAAAPNLGRYLMDMCFSRIRFVALETLIDAFKNTKVKIAYVVSVLGFLSKPEGESAPVITNQGRSRSNTPTVKIGNLHLRFDEDANGKAAEELVLPGCAKTSVVGKHAAEVDEAQACAAAVNWLRSCNANVLLDSGAQPSTALLDCKPGIRLSMPEDVAAVAHGDATLNLQNFMHPVRVS